MKELQLVNERSILKKLSGKNSNDIYNFYSTCNEVILGKKIKDKGFEIQYEKSFGKLIPDWCVSKNGVNIIIDVKSLFPTRKDINKHQFQDQLSSSIKGIKKNIYVRIRIAEDISDYDSINIEQNKIEFEKWLKKNMNQGQIFKYENIIIEIVKIDTNYDHICVSMPGGIIDIDDRRLFASETLNKANRYREIIENLGMSFILAIFNHPLNGLDYEDVQKLLYGPSLYNETYNKEYSILSGIFYNLEYRDLISGVLWIESESSELKYFHNYVHDRILEELFLN